jgi:hypothetical protein
VLHVPDLVYRQRDLDLSSLGAPFHFRAGWPTPSTFEFDAIVRERPVEAPMLGTETPTNAAGTTLFAGNRWRYGELTKELLSCPGREASHPNRNHPLDGR